VINRPENKTDHWWFEEQSQVVRQNTEAPAVSDLTDQQIIELAQSTAKSCGYKFDGNIDECLTSLGGELSFTDFWKNFDDGKGSIWVMKRRKFKIWLSERASKRLNLFTIAHELGHYIVHYENSDLAESGKFMVAARYGRGPVERQADIFALNFLAPRDHLERLIRTEDVEGISNRVCVDRYLINQQIKQFELICMYW